MKALKLDLASSGAVAVLDLLWLPLGSVAVWLELPPPKNEGSMPLMPEPELDGAAAGGLFTNALDEARKLLSLTIPLNGHESAHSLNA